MFFTKFWRFWPGRARLARRRHPTETRTLFLEELERRDVPSTFTFHPDGDAYVQQIIPNTPNGLSTHLYCINSPAVDSLAHFRVTGVSGIVQTAKLRFYLLDGSTNGPDVYATATNWAESTVTWNTKPARTSGVLDNPGAVAAGTWMQFNVHAVVQGNGTFSFELATTSSDKVEMYSRQGTYPPQLVLTTVPSLSASPGAAQKKGEGSPVTFSGSAKGGFGPYTYSWNFGDGATASGSLTPSHPFADSGTYKVMLTVMDTTGATVSTATTVTVSNVAPAVLSLQCAASVNEGDSISLGGSFSDLGTLDTHQLLINWGDASSATTVNLAAGVLTFSGLNHPYLNNPAGKPAGSYALTVTVSDNDGGKTTATKSVQVNNVAPQVSAGGPYSAVPNALISFAGSVVDPSPVDQAKGFSYIWKFGDGASSTLANPTHRYALAGTYTVTLTASDKDGGKSTGNTTAVVAPASAGITDANAVYTVPHVNKPGYLASFTDPVFGTKVTRISGDPGTAVPNLNSGVWSSDARHNYQLNEPWNADGTLIYMENRTSDGGTPEQLYLDGNTYAVKFGAPSNMPGGGSYDQRWNPNPAHADEVILATHGGTTLYWFNVVTNQVTRTWSLPIATSYIGNTKGNASQDGRFIALGDLTHFFIVDMDPQAPYAAYPNQRIGPVFDLATLGINATVNAFSISPSGKYMVVHYNKLNGNSGDFEQVFNVDPNTLALSPRPMPTPAWPGMVGDPALGFIYPLGHEDMGLNPFDNNQDVAIGQEHAGNVGQNITGINTVNSDGIGHVVMVRLSDGAVTSLTDPGNGSSVPYEAYASHISLRAVNRPGWAYVSYYPGNDPGGDRYSEEVIAVKLDGSGQVERYAHLHSDWSNFTGTTAGYSSADSDYNYRSEPHAVPSPDGKRIIFASNWVYQGNGGQAIQDYVIDTGLG